jgi:acyl-CoA synthetase (AMP-forming)/AMP-acid ligase II/1-acyl-sn-glycerol-3-phosphate acyltransferase/acyl carrier protein
VNGLRRIFWIVVRLLLRLRYRVTTDGCEQLERLSGPVLVLPNHPAYVDPPTVLSHTASGLFQKGLRQPLRPLVFSGTYRVPPLLPLMKLVRAFEVPDLSSASRDAASRTTQLIDAVVEEVHAGGSFLIYPSGRLQRGNREVVGSARFVHELVSRCPELRVVLVRTRGLWGSMFSCAAEGAPPDLVPTVLRAAAWVVAGLFFFLPKRHVHLHVEVMPRSRLPLESRDAFNRFLENWYDADGEQEPRFVRYNPIFGPSEGHYRSAVTVSVDVASLSPKTIDQVNELVASFLKRDLEQAENSSETTLESLGLDSLDRMELALRIEQQFGFHSSAVVSTLGELWALADGKLCDGDGSLPPLDVPPNWFASAKYAQPSTLQAGANGWLLADTVAEAFALRVLQRPDQVAAADGLSGAVTYRRMLVGAVLMARRFAKLPDQHVGVMMPASVAADIVFFALHLAGKIPVMLNWTTGPASLAHAIEATDTRQILTSKRLVDRLGIEVAGGEYLFLEDVRGTIKKAEAVATMLVARVAPSRLLRKLPSQKQDDPAVFLFTSGSESAPKTVPLTHRNLLTNILDGIDVLKPTSNDTLLGFLPPFHSFGLTGNVLLPVLTGIRCVRHADPTDARGLVQVIRDYQPTMVFTTPTFLSYILAASGGDELISLRKVITGAEACPESVYTTCSQKAPAARILEGYGITECSPVVAANRLDKVKQGTIGLPVRHVETRIVHHETGEAVAQGGTGMLLVRGPSIFAGYHRYDGPSPFVEFEGQAWYRTGDLVAADEDGYLHFRGRLKRFLKAGGEMISLPALELPFQKRYPADENGPRVAVEGVETPGGRHVVLFTTFELSLRDAAEMLLADGLRGVMRLDDVRRIDAIPVLGTGKTDYVTLRKQIEASLQG